MISIIMPVYNAQAYLVECLESILKQKLMDWELCAVNDGSTDESLSILQDFAIRDNRVRVFDNPDKGLIEALRLGYRRSYGEFITRMDADDLMPPDKLETLLRNCVMYDKTVATAKVKYFSDVGISDGYRRYAEWLNSLVDQKNHWDHIYKECVIPSPCWMMRRKDFNAIGAFDPDRYPEDYDLAFRMYAFGLKVFGEDDVLHLWRDHAQRSSRTDEHYSDNRFLDIKLHYFLSLEAKDDRPIALWGAGAKGKYIAKGLIEAKRSFVWVTDNPRKIGVDIYGSILLSSSVAMQMSSSPRFIMAVAGPEEQIELKERLREHSDVFWFC